VTLVRSIGAARLAAMATVTLTLIGFFALIIMRATAPQMMPLFTDLSLTDSGAIVKTLEGERIPYELQADGSAIMVPKEDAARLRMRLAEQGLPTGGGIGYEIFDKADAFSTTSFVQNVNQLRALEGELARSIRALGRVASARVHLVLPERVLFSRDAPAPTASIVLKLRGQLEAGQVRAIRHLVASAVQGLKPERISIIDDSGRLLADGAETAEGGQGNFDERLIGFERRIKDQVEAIVERVVGQGRARVEVRAELDYNKLTQTSDQFDPESRVARSTQTREERSRTADTQATVSVGNELPNAGANAAAPPRDESSKNEELVNFEISRTTRTEVQEAGRVKRISVAVLVDGIQKRAADGALSYEARSTEDLARIGALVRSAIGFDATRGDQVEVVNLQFAETAGVLAAAETPEGLFAFGKDDIMRGVELAILLVLSVLIIVFALRPMVRRILASDQVRSLRSLAEASGMPALAGPVGAVTELPAPSAPDRVDLAQINQFQTQSVQRVGELVQRNPNETVAIIRQWLQEPA
jgi:flagellar M-ring protein FliF